MNFCSLTIIDRVRVAVRLGCALLAGIGLALPAPAQAEEKVIHPVEALFTVMGPSCEQVRRVKARGTDLVVGVWKDGRIGTFRDLRGGKPSAVVVIHGTQGSSTGQTAGYAVLLQEIVRFFKTGKPPVPAKETIEIYAFMSTADESKAQNGAAVSIPDLIDRAKHKR